METVMSIEWHEDVLPHDLDWRAICPHMVIIYAWMRNKKLLDKAYTDEEPYLSSYKGLEDGTVTMDEFIESCFDGELSSDCILSDESKEFFAEYLTVSYTDDLEKFFNVPVIYRLPPDWESCKKFFRVIDQRYQQYQQELPWALHDWS